MAILVPGYGTPDWWRPKSEARPESITTFRSADPSVRTVGTTVYAAMPANTRLNL